MFKSIDLFSFCFFDEHHKITFRDCMTHSVTIFFSELVHFVSSFFIFYSLHLLRITLDLSFLFFALIFVTINLAYRFFIMSHFVTHFTLLCSILSFALKSFFFDSIDIFQISASTRLSWIFLIDFFITFCQFYAHFSLTSLLMILYFNNWFMRVIFDSTFVFTSLFAVWSILIWHRFRYFIHLLQLIQVCQHTRQYFINNVFRNQWLDWEKSSF